MRPRREGRGNDDGGRMGLVRRPASMRPRREGRGNPDGRGPLGPRQAPASMRPRREGRGNTKAIKPRRGLALLQ